MDQGFEPQGLAANDAFTIGRDVATRAPSRIQGFKPTVLETAVKGAVSNNKKNWDAKQRDPSQQTVVRLDGAKNLFMFPAQMEFIGGIAGAALGWVTSKFGWQRATAAIGMVLKAPVHALRNTTLANLFQVPANFLNEASEEATRAGDKAKGMATRTKLKADDWAKLGTSAETRVATFFKPARKMIGAGIERFEGSGIHDMFNSALKNRHTAAIARHDTAFTNIEKALTTEASTDWKASIGNFFSRRFKGTQPATVPVGELSSIMEGIQGAKGDATALKTVATDLEKLIASDSLGAEAKARAGNVTKHIGKLIGSAHAMDTYGKAIGGNMKTMVKAMGAAVGRVPVFNALLAVGITAGMGATLLASRAESKEAKLAFKDLSSQLGASDSGLLEAVKKAQKSQGMMGVAKTGMRLVGNVADGAMWMLPGGGGAAMISASVLPMLFEMLAPGNPTLGAFVAISKDDTGALKLDRDARVQAIRHLVAVMPAVAAKGGLYNHLAQPIAAEMVERNLSTKQVVQLLGNNASFTQLSREVAEKISQKGTAVAKANVSNDNAALHPAAQQTQAAMSSAEAAYHHADKPMSKVAANDVQLNGKATSTQLQVG